MRDKLRPSDALLVVDVQRDFCRGGASPVPGADDVVPVLNEWIRSARAAGIPVVAARDWHPADHCSFVEQGGDWPAHCVRDTSGADLHPELDLPQDSIVVSKGTMSDRDTFSAFDDTGLADTLHARGVERVWIGGLVQEVGVRASVIDACEAGFDTHLIAGATRPADRAPGDGQRALEAMRAAGAHIEAAA